jgi:hypothetical protein
MKLLTLGLAAGAAYLFLKNNQPAPAAVVITPAPATVTPSAPDSVIQYTGTIPGVAGSIQAAGASPVAPANITPTVTATGLGAIADGCGCGGGLGAVPPARAALKAQLQALKAKFQPQINQAIATGDRAAMAQLSAALSGQMRALLTAYHAANPSDHATSLSRSVAPVFMSAGLKKRAG